MKTREIADRRHHFAAPHDHDDPSELRANFTYDSLKKRQGVSEDDDVIRVELGPRGHDAESKRIS